MRMTGTLPPVAQVDVVRLGEEIRLERQRLGWTQAELARKIHRDQAVVSSVESGSHGLRISLLDQIAQALLGPKGLGLLLLRAGAIDLSLPLEELLASDPDLSDDSRELMRKLYRRARAFDAEEGAVSPRRAPEPGPGVGGA